MVQHTDISQIATAEITSDVCSGSSAPVPNDAERRSAITLDTPVVGCAAGGKARRSSLFQQTAAGIKAAFQIATGNNQVEPALFGEVSLRACAALLRCLTRRDLFQFAVFKALQLR